MKGKSSLAAVTAVGNDRTGIVAAVTRVLFEEGCNLEDATSTILSGHFSMMLVVTLPEGATSQQVEKRLAAVASDFDLVITVRDVYEAHLEAVEATHVISVYGGDRPGIVYRVAEHLSAAGVNITDLSSRVIGSEASRVYALMLEVAAGPEVTSAILEDDLAELKQELGVDISVNEIESDIL
ncbi:MAG: glycine cleavage system protein R [Actinomycetota bacterium]